MAFNGKLSMFFERMGIKGLFVLSAIPLIAAYISEYGFGLEPCILCIYQRIPYALMVGLAFAAYLLRKKISKKLLMVFLLFFLTEVAIALYHVGVEQGMIVQEVGCADDVQANSIEELKAQLLAKPNVPCDKPQFEFIGLSMAAWNSLYAAALSFILIVLIKQRNKSGM